MQSISVMDESSYWVYYNLNRGRVINHRGGCSDVKKRGGVHGKNAKGGWKGFEDEDAAREFAIEKSRHPRIDTLKDCDHCTSRGWAGLLS